MNSTYIFNELSKDSLTKISDQINNENGLKEEHCDKKNKAKYGWKIFSNREKRIKKKDLEFLTENTLPERLKKRFPPKFYGRPIDEIDEFYKTKNVCFKKIRPFF